MSTGTGAWISMVCLLVAVSTIVKITKNAKAHVLNSLKHERKIVRVRLVICFNQQLLIYIYSLTCKV